MLNIPTFQTAQIHVIGTGGTGGYAIEYLARLLAGTQHQIHLYDGDIVELKNLKRQNFTSQDIDVNKAEALANRLSVTIDSAPEIIAHPNYIVDADDFMAELMMGVDDEQVIILQAVDNIATRRLINGVIDELTDILPILAFDSGNDDQGGQVVFYSNTSVKADNVMHKLLNNGGSQNVSLPNMLTMFPEIDVIKDVHDENPGLVQNCAENAESKPQSMMINVRNGDLLASLTYHLLDNHTLPGNLWKSDLLTGNTSCSQTYLK